MYCGVLFYIININQMHKKGFDSFQSNRFQVSRVGGEDSADVQGRGGQWIYEFCGGVKKNKTAFFEIRIVLNLQT